MLRNRWPCECEKEALYEPNQAYPDYKIEFWINYKMDSR